MMRRQFSDQSFAGVHKFPSLHRETVSHCFFALRTPSSAKPPSRQRPSSALSGSRVPRLRLPSPRRPPNAHQNVRDAVASVPAPPQPNPRASDDMEGTAGTARVAAQRSRRPLPAHASPCPYQLDAHLRALRCTARNLMPHANRLCPAGAAVAPVWLLPCVSPAVPALSQTPLNGLRRVCAWRLHCFLVCPTQAGGDLFAPTGLGRGAVWSRSGKGSGNRSGRGAERAAGGQPLSRRTLGPVHLLYRSCSNCLRPGLERERHGRRPDRPARPEVVRAWRTAGLQECMTAWGWGPGGNNAPLRGCCAVCCVGLSVRQVGPQAGAPGNSMGRWGESHRGHAGTEGETLR